MVIRFRTTWILLVLGLAVTTAPGLGQEPPDQEQRTRNASLDSQPAFTLEGAAVPFAVRAEALIRGIARLHAQDAKEGTERVADFLRTLGFDPKSVAARDLLEAAVTVEREHPMVSEVEKARAAGGGGLDLEQPGGWVDQRFAKVGQALGVWLVDRRAEGWAIEPLLDRMLNGSHLTVSLFSDDARNDNLSRIGRQCAAFHDTLRAELGHVPRRFEQRLERSLR